MLDEQRIKGTFFVLGWVADQVPQLVKRIAALGHEVACHGYSHELIYRQTPGVFAEETRRAKTLLEDLTGMPVIGYRAASFSITPRSRWALDTLIEQGFLYDSSIFPVRHDRYGMPGADRARRVYVHAPSGGRIAEFPMSTAAFGPVRVPVSGGGLFPAAAVLVHAQRAAQHQRARRHAVHVLSASLGNRRRSAAASTWASLSRFRHYTNLRKMRGRGCGGCSANSASRPCVTSCARADYCHLEVPEAVGRLDSRRRSANQVRNAISD